MGGSGGIPPIAANSACMPRASDPIATTVARMRSIRFPVNRSNSVSAVPGDGILLHASRRTVSACTGGSVGRDDAILHRAAKQIDLRRSRPPHLDVLHAHAIDVLLGGRVGHPQPFGDDLQRETRGVQAQDLAFAHRELCICEVAVSFDSTGPFNVVEGLTSRDRANGVEYIVQS